MFRDRAAIVTGGGSGIGEALCRALAARGARVIVADVNLAGAQRVAGEIGARAEACALDVSDRAAVEALVQSSAAAHGRLDLMFNNAGISLAADVRDMTWEQWRRIIDINLLGVLHGALAAYRHMAGQGGGHIVNTASMAGLIGYATTAAYTTTKYGVVGFSEALRAEGQDLGVRVSVACPGLIDTPMLQAGRPLNVDPARVKPPPAKPASALGMADAILRGVERNEGVIIYPPSARLIWWLYRLRPGLVQRLIHLPVVRDFRAARRGDSSAGQAAR